MQVRDRQFRVEQQEPSPHDPLAVWGSAWTSSTLESGMTMIRGDRRVAGTTLAELQESGDFVLFAGGQLTRRTQTLGADRLVMQPDGNLVLYVTEDDNRPVVPYRYTGTVDHPGAQMVVQPDGNLVVYDTQGRALYSPPNRIVPFFV